MKKLLLIILICFAAVLSLNTPSVAIPFHFDVSGKDSYVHLFNVKTGLFVSGVNAELSEGLDDMAFDLDPGESIVFDFFDIAIDGFLGFASAGIKAQLAFDSPGMLHVADTGIFSGFTFFQLSKGSVQWDGTPSITTLGNGDQLTFSFFNMDKWIWGIDNTMTVQAQITYDHRETAPVPEPTTMMLFGVGLLFLAKFSKDKLYNLN